MAGTERFLEKSGDVYSLALENRFTDSILTELRAKTMFVPGMFGAEDALPGQVIAEKTINYGKSHRFEWFGADYAAEEHTPGDEMIGQQFEFDKGTITVDPFIVKHFVTALEDYEISHYNPDSSISRAIGIGLAEELDDRAVLTCISAARTAALTKNGITIHPGGNLVSRVDASATSVDDTSTGPYTDDSTGSGNIDDDVAELAYKLDQDGVPDEGRYLVIHPWIRSLLRHETTQFNRDFTGSGGDRNMRMIGQWHGFNVLNPYKRMPTGLNTDKPSKYQVDCTVATGIPAALAFCGASTGQAAIGLVKAAEMRGYVEAQETKNTIFHKGQLMCGFGVLHPQCAGLIQITAA
ncbi:MAG: hypothetical protein P1V36_06600 [Planctomycetota bacterium]|nr:hypothetical protein [Planctomycetota bacterium]